MRLAACLATAFLLATAAQASVVVRQDLSVTPSVDIPVTLAAGTSGSTALGASATSASTTAIVPGVVALQALRILPGATAWEVRLRATGATGITGLEAAILAVVGTTTQTLTLLPATAFPSTSGAVAVPAAGAPLSITIATVVACSGCSLTLEFLFTPVGGSGPLLVYPYTLATS